MAGTCAIWWSKASAMSGQRQPVGSAMRLVRFQSQHQEAMIALHRSAIEGFSLGMSREEDEADLMDIEGVYLRQGGEFLLGLSGGRLIAMGGFKRLSTDTAELRRMRIARDVQGRGHGSLLLRE